MASEHPTHDILLAYLKGELPLDKTAEVESHLSECDQCVEVLAGLSGHEEIERRLKRYRPRWASMTYSPDSSNSNVPCA